MKRKRRSHFNFEKNQNDSKNLLLHPQNRIQEKFLTTVLAPKQQQHPTRETRAQQSQIYIFLKSFISLRLCGFYCKTHQRKSTKMRRNT